MHRLFPVFLIILFLIPAAVISQAVPQYFVNSEYDNVPEEYNILAQDSYRKIIDLNGTWEVSYDSGNSWSTIDVPSSVEFNGVMHYLKRFTLPDDASDYQIQLNALGINFFCSIRLNGVFVGSHTAGYSSFSMDIVKTILRPGEENILEIEVDGRTAFNSPVYPRPFSWGWKSYSGIFREIFLVMIPKLAISDVVFDYSLDNDLNECNAVLKVMIRNYTQETGDDQPGTDQNLRQEDIREAGYYVEIFNKRTGTLVKSTASEPRFLQVFRAVEDTINMNFRNPELWSPENPVRYEMVITLIRRGSIIIDRQTKLFGFRKVDFQPDGLYLNNEKYTVQGVYRMEMHPDYGISLPWEVQRSDAQRIKNLGVNAVRTGPFPNHSYFYDICDELGILVLEEIPATNWNSGIVNSPEYIDQAWLFLQDMINRDRFHPSIAAWGIGSGLNTAHENTTVYINEIKSRIRQIDNRPIYYSSEIQTGDICTDLVDFRLVDLYEMEIRSLRNLFDDLNSGRSSKPSFIGRIGANVIPDNVEGYQNPMSLAHQAKFLQDVYETVESGQSIPGVFYWSLTDWRGDVPVISSGIRHDNSVYYRGLMDEQRIERPAYTYLQSAMTNGQAPTLSMGESPVESQRSIIFTGFGIILLFLILVKQDRWFGMSYRRSLMSAKIFFEDVFDRRNMHMWHSIALAITECTSISIGLASAFYYFRQDIYFDFLISQVFTSVSAKQALVYLAWHPVMSIMVITFVIFAFLIILSILFGITLSLSGVSRGVSFAFNLLTWSASFLVFLIPLSMAVYSMLEHDVSYYFISTLGGIILIVYMGRFLLALKVTTGIRFKKCLTGMLLILILVFGGFSMYFEGRFQTFTYWNHYLTIVKSLQK